MKLKNQTTFLLAAVIGISLSMGLMGFSGDQVLWCDRPFKTTPIPLLQRICFGSCAHQNKQQYLLAEIAKLKPDLMVYLGDNIYADTKNMRVMREKYGMLSCKKEFRQLVNATHIIATWDDHDFGKDDAGMEYPMKKESKAMFLEFWNEPKNSDRYKHDGVYTSYYYGDSAHRVQIILLDLRYFRTAMLGPEDHYQPNYDTTAAMMDSTEWAWLHGELLKPARIRIIGSSTEFASQQYGWETWGNFPLQQKKMFDMIKETRAAGVIFISGDVHYAELSMQKQPGLYPIYDMTSSGITQVELNARPNQYRIDKTINTRNFGMLDIDWSKPDPSILIRGFDYQAKERIIHSVKLSELQFPPM
jgi:alkaline phosphatase D